MRDLKASGFFLLVFRVGRFEAFQSSSALFEGLKASEKF